VSGGKALDGDAVLIMLTDGAKQSKKLKWETVRVFKSVNKRRILHVSIRASLVRIPEI
jgi:hypothetical protein